MHELSFPRPADSSRRFASLTTITLEDGDQVTFARTGSTVYVCDAELDVWDHAYMIVVAEGRLSYMRSPEVYGGAESMIVYPYRVASVS